MGEELSLDLDWTGDETGDHSKITISSLRQTGGSISLQATIVSEHGLVSRDLGTVKLAPHGSIELPILPQQVEPLRATKAPANLHFTATAHFDDGTRASKHIEPAYWHENRVRAARAVKLAFARDELMRPVAANVDLPTDTATPISTRSTVSARLCFNQITTYEQGTGNEDHFLETVPTARPARGQRIRLWAPGVPTTSAPTLDVFLSSPSASEACTSTQTLTVGTWTAKASSAGKVDNATINVFDADDAKQLQEFQFSVQVVGGQATQTFTFDPNSEAHNAYVAAAWSIHKVWWGDTDTLDIVVNEDHESNSHYHTSGNEVHLEPDAHDNKYTIAHEIGHWVTDAMTDWSFGAASHSSTSKENQRLAAGEGFANFYAAQVFNLTNESDCWYRSVDCEASTESHPRQLMETLHSSPYAGMGNETDWLRTFWDMRTEGVTTGAILDWIDTANNSTAWAPENSYRLLDARANAIGGTFDAEWDEYKVWNGIDHPDSP